MWVIHHNIRQVSYYGRSNFIRVPTLGQGRRFGPQSVNSTYNKVPFTQQEVTTSLGHTFVSCENYNFKIWSIVDFPQNWIQNDKLMLCMKYGCEYYLLHKSSITDFLVEKTHRNV